MIALAAWWACAPEPVGAPEPGDPEEQMTEAEAFAELRSFVLAEPAAWCGCADYHPDDPALVDPRIRKVLEQRNFGRMPPTTADRQRFARATANSVFATALAQPEWRAAVEAKVAARFAAPAVTRGPDGGLVADLGLCPGPLTQWSSGRWGIAQSDRADRGQLRGELVARHLAALTALDSAAPWFELRVQVPVGHRSPERYRYRYDPVADVLYVLLASQEGTVWVSPAPLGGDVTTLGATRPTRTEELRPLRRGRDLPAF